MIGRPICSECGIAMINDITVWVCMKCKREVKVTQPGSKTQKQKAKRVERLVNQHLACDRHVYDRRQLRAGIVPRCQRCGKEIIEAYPQDRV